MEKGHEDFIKELVTARQASTGECSETSSSSSTSMSNGDNSHSPGASIPQIEVSSTDNFDGQIDQSPRVKTGGLFPDSSYVTCSTRRKSEGDIPKIQCLKIREEAGVSGTYKCDLNIPSSTKDSHMLYNDIYGSPWRKKRANSLTYDIGIPREYPAPMSLHMSDNKVIPAQRRRSFTAELQTLEPIKEDINLGANKV